MPGKIKIVLLVFIILSQVKTAQVQTIEPGQTHPTAFAIIADSKTYENCKPAINSYKNAIEKDGLSAYVVYSDWKTPEEVKNEILKLYSSKPMLEGVVFVGEIPIPMIRNAQHMTSAFKLDEDKYPWYRSSVPSDRFYDDFDLKFEYLSQDTVNTLAYYYSLSPDSPQRIQREIYSARIKPSGVNIDKYAAISKYLDRIAKIKEEINVIDNAFVFLGHGYLSESLTAWADERLSLQEQFPGLFKPGGRIKNLLHEMSREMKEILMLELQKEELDIALFHAHGDTDIQLFLSFPVPRNVNENIESVKMYLRSKLRTAKRRNQQVEQVKENYMKDLDVPASWFEGTFGDSLIAADSIVNYRLDMHIGDVRNISPQAKFIMFDQCFNGSFHLDEYIAGEYVFGNGNVVVGAANSVNVLQDKWADEFLGWLDKGVRTGLVHREINLLESHLIGDPTYRFTGSSEIDLNKMLVLDRYNASKWEKLLKSADDILRETAVREMYYNLKDKFEDELVRIYLSDKSVNVRLHALKSLAEIDGDGFRKVLFHAINDPFELIRRKAAEWMGEVGDKAYLPLLVDAVLHDESERVVFNGRSSLGFIDISGSAVAAKKAINDLPEIASKDLIMSSLVPSLERNRAWIFDEVITSIKNDSLKLSKRQQGVRTFRNYKFTEAVPELISILQDENMPDEIRINMAEALGWFSFSLKKPEIIKALEKVINQTSTSENLKKETLRTKNRLATGANDVMIP